LSVKRYIFAGADLYLNYDGPDGDSYIYFYDAGSVEGEFLFWNATDERFEFSNDLYVAGAAVCVSLLE